MKRGEINNQTFLNGASTFPDSAIIGRNIKSDFFPANAFVALLQGNDNLPNQILDWYTKLHLNNRACDITTQFYTIIPSQNFENLSWAMDHARRVTTFVISDDSIHQQYEKKLTELGFELENPKEIIDFLLKNTGLDLPLYEAKDEIEKYFEKSILNLFLYKDCEEKYETLNLRIFHTLPIEKAIQNESDLFDNWFEKYYISCEGKLTIREYPIQ